MVWCEAVGLRHFEMESLFFVRITLFDRHDMIKGPKNEFPAHERLHLVNTALAHVTGLNSWELAMGTWPYLRLPECQTINALAVELFQQMIWRVGTILGLVKDMQ